MCPAGIATAHPPGDLLANWSQLGCPAKMGQPWSKQEMGKAVAQGPHQSSLSSEAVVHFECVEKIKARSKTCPLRQHQRWPASTAEDITYFGNTSQVEGLIYPSVFSSSTEAYWTLLMPPLLKWLHRKPLTNWGMPSAGSSMPLPRPRTTPRYLWQSGM